MSLEIPDLDDRTYAEIVEDARKRIPLYSEQWTDHNASDPGITILELLAWLAETYTYQLDRITDAHRLKYLALLGEKPRPPRPADVDLDVSLPECVGSMVVEPSVKLVATDDTGVRHGFEATEKTRLTAARVARVVTDGDRGRIDYSTANKTPGMHYAAFDESATAGNAFYLGFEGNPFAGSSELSLTVRLHEADLPKPATHGEAADSWTEPVDFEPSVAVQWQHCLEYKNWHRDGSEDSVWAPVPVADDETDELVGQLYRSGRVVLHKPDDWVSEVCEGDELFGLDDTYWWIRCVLREDGYESTPRFDSITVNVLPAEHRWTVDGGEDHPALEDADGNTASTGLPGQTFRFTSPLASDTGIDDKRGTSLIVRDDEDIVVLVGGQRWEWRDDFDGSGPHDRHYILDLARGEVRFGDGVRGKLPPEGMQITASRYVSGGGSKGNLAPSTTWAFAPPSVTGSAERSRKGMQCRNQSGKFMQPDPTQLTITQPEAAVGGDDAESIDEAFDRLLDDRQLPYRAVSLADYEYLATHTPGLRFGRAAARLVTNDPVEKVRPYRTDRGCGHERSDDIETERKPGALEVETPMVGQSVYTEQSSINRFDERKPDREGAATGERRTYEARIVKERTALGARAVRRQRSSGAQSADESGSDDRTRPTKDVEVQSNGEHEATRYCEPHHEVRVVVVPFSRSSKPKPSTGFRDAVQRHLDRHRLLTDRVIIERPQYVDVGIDAAIRLESEFGIEDREDAVADALNTFLDPLRGFEGDGWPFGRTLYRSELYEVIEGVPGVDYVTRLGIRLGEERAVDVRRDANGNIHIEETALFSPEEHAITAQVDTQANRCGRRK